MNTNDLLQKVEDFFNLSKHKQEKKHHKLVKILHKLENKKDGLEAELITAGKADDTSARYRELRKELKVVRKLIKKAKKHDAPN